MVCLPTKERVENLLRKLRRQPRSFLTYIHNLPAATQLFIEGLVLLQLMKPLALQTQGWLASAAPMSIKKRFTVCAESMHGWCPTHLKYVGWRTPLEDDASSDNKEVKDYCRADGLAAAIVRRQERRAARGKGKGASKAVAIARAMTAEAGGIPRYDRPT